MTSYSLRIAWLRRNREVPDLKVKNDNRGAALVTVLVVTAFVSIIATTMLYITSRNFIVKQVDYNNTTSFYEAEEALDSLKALLVQDVSNAYMYAYADAMSNYLDFNKEIKEYYANSYFDRLEYYWKDRASTYSDFTTCVKKYMLDNGVDENVVKCITEVGSYKTHSESGKFVIMGVKAEYTDENGYSTYISVDIGLEAPDVDFDMIVSTSDGKTDSDKSSTGGTGSSNPIDIASCVKYMNWQRY
jgi:hypothetical protein